MVLREQCAVYSCRQLSKVLMFLLGCVVLSCRFSSFSLNQDHVIFCNILKSVSRRIIDCVLNHHLFFSIYSLNSLQQFSVICLSHEIHKRITTHKPFPIIDADHADVAPSPSLTRTRLQRVLSSRWHVYLSLQSAKTGDGLPTTQPCFIDNSSA